MEPYIQIFIHYLKEIVPALALGFLISGIVHEFIPEEAVSKYLGSGGVMPIFYASLIGTLLPICCWGTLPIAVSFYKKGAKLGPVLAFLVATPATSISALLVAYSIMGGFFTAYIFFAVIIMGMAVGLIGNTIKYTPRTSGEPVACPHCASNPEHIHAHKKKTTADKIVSVLKYAYIQMPKEIGLELFIGLILASVVAVFVPIGTMIKTFLGGWLGYLFAIVFGILMYICSTATVPLVDSLVRQGMNAGAGMTLLLIGPVTSYGTLLVIRKEYGTKVLLIFLTSLIIASLLLGLGFQALKIH